MPTVTFTDRITRILPFVFFVNLSLISQVRGFSTGAPPNVCINMFPKHGVLERNSTPPYTISVSSNSYFPKQQILVTIEGQTGTSFRGFMLAARRKRESDNFGRFIPVSGTHGVTCNNKQDSAITHSDKLDKAKLEFTWEAPDKDEGDLEIIGTILQSAYVFWANVTSLVMKPSFQYGSTSSPGDTVVSSFTTTPSPPVVNEIRCQSSKDCLIQWKMDKDAGVTHFDFGLESLNENMYISLGLSRDVKMGDDSVMECLRYPNSSIIAQLSFNDGYSNALVPSGSVTQTSSSFENGWMRCSFTRRNTVNNSKIFDLSGNDWYLLVAIGKVDISKPRQKAYHSIKFVSETKIDLSKNEGLLGVGSSGKILVSVHGTLMVFAWVFFASVGMFAARYSKTIDQTIKGVALWFQFHRISMVMTLLFTVVGFILIFVAKEGKYSQSVGLPYDAHPVLGIIVTILTITNPIMAYFRPGKDSSSRFWFNWAHRSVGVIALILADAAIFIGIFWVNLTKQKSSIAAMSIFLIYKFIAVLTMELLECWKQHTVVQIEMKVPGEKSAEEKKEDEDFSFIKTILLICHIVITFILSVILVIFLNIGMKN